MQYCPHLKPCPCVWTVWYWQWQGHRPRWPMLDKTDSYDNFQICMQYLAKPRYKEKDPVRKSIHQVEENLWDSFLCFFPDVSQQNLMTSFWKISQFFRCFWKVRTIKKKISSIFPTWGLDFLFLYFSVNNHQFHISTNEVIWIAQKNVGKLFVTKNFETIRYQIAISLIPSTYPFDAKFFLFGIK